MPWVSDKLAQNRQVHRRRRSLLITFFYRQMPKLIENGHLYLAVPPLYRLCYGGKTFYARGDQHKDELLRREFHANAKVEIGRFKGLGEMMASQLKETTMDPKRTLLRVMLVTDDREEPVGSIQRSIVRTLKSLRINPPVTQHILRNVTR